MDIDLCKVDRAIGEQTLVIGTRVANCLADQVANLVFDALTVGTENDKLELNKQQLRKSVEKRVPKPIDVTVRFKKKHARVSLHVAKTDDTPRLRHTWHGKKRDAVTFRLWRPGAYRIRIKTAWHETKTIRSPRFAPPGGTIDLTMTPKPR